MIIAVGGLIYLDRNAGEIVENILRKEYQGSEISKVYNIKYSKVSLVLFSGNLVIKDLEIKPKDSFFSEDDSLRYKYPIVYNLKVPKLSINGLTANFSLKLKHIQLENVEISNPEITMIDHLSVSEKKMARNYYKDQKADTTTMKTGIENFNLSQFSVYDGSFSFINRINNVEKFRAGKINVRINNLELETTRIVKTLITRTFEEAYVSFADICYPTPDGFYQIKIGEIENNIGDRNITVYNFELIPQYSKADFGKKFGKQTDRMEVKLAKLEIVGFDMEKLVLDNSILIDNILIDELYLNAYRDKNIPFDYLRFPKFPQQSLSNLDFDLNVKKIEITHSEVLYEQLGEDATEPGKIPITNLYATIINVSNMPKVIADNGSMRWDIQADFFDAGRLELEVVFTKNIKSPDFSFHGKMGEMDMAAFNSMIENTEYLRIDHGLLRSLTFEAVANEEYSQGELIMIYDSLHITGLKKMREKEKAELGLLSAVANMVIRKFNPPRKSNDKPEPAAIFFVRDKNKSIFNYLAKSLISGIKATIVPGVASNSKKKYDKKQKKEQNNKEKSVNREERRRKKANKK